MAYSIIKNTNNISNGVKEFIVNTIADIDTLPLNASSGSTCICLEDKELYILTVKEPSKEKEWKKL